jgi:hypothetical protein
VVVVVEVRTFSTQMCRMVVQVVQEEVVSGGTNPGTNGLVVQETLQYSTKSRK